MLHVFRQFCYIFRSRNYDIFVFTKQCGAAGCKDAAYKNKFHIGQVADQMFQQRVIEPAIDATNKTNLWLWRNLWVETFTKQRKVSSILYDITVFGQVVFTVI